MARSRIQREKAKHRTGLMKRLASDNEKFKPKTKKPSSLGSLISSLKEKMGFL